MEQARVCAAHLADSGAVRFSGTQPATQLKVSGIQLYAVGDLRRDVGSEDLVLRDAKQGIYKRLVVDDNRVRGAVLYGDTRDSHWYLELINGRQDISAIRDGLLFGEAHCQTPP
jgi:nitrite reductase (NADH) large subunit